MKILLLIYFFILNFINTLKWSPEALAEKVPSWNYLNDPEDLINDKKLGPKIHTSYLTQNHVYDKTDVNLFLISDIIEKYIYKKRQFVEDLYKEMEKNENINNKDKKQHHLILVLIKKTNELFIYGSSDKLRKLLPNDEVVRIELEIKKTMETRNYAQAVYYTFEKLNVLWKRFSIFKKQNPYSNKSNYTNVTDILKIISSIFILGLFIYVIIMRKKEEPNFDNSNKKRKKN
jgi:hypothetical protein